MVTETNKRNTLLAGQQAQATGSAQGSPQVTVRHFFSPPFISTLFLYFLQNFCFPSIIKWPYQSTKLLHISYTGGYAIVSK